MLKNKYLIKSGTLGLMLAVAVIVSIAIQGNIIFAQDKKQAEKHDLNSDTETPSIQQLLKTGKFDLAIERAEEYLISNPDDITVINILSEAYIAKGDLSSAETVVKRALAIQPSRPDSCRLLARIYRTRLETDPAVKAEDFTLALEQIQRGLASNPNDVWLMAEEAQIYSDQGDKEKANQLIDKAISFSTPADKSFLMQIKETINKPKVYLKK